MAVESSAKPYTGPMLVPSAQYAGRPAIRLHRPVYVIGSRSDARIHLVSSTVSRTHALLVQTRHETYIRDLGSRTSVFVNGKKVREAVLRNGDLLAIGKFTFEYQIDAKPRDEEPPTLPATLQVTGAEFPIPIEERVLLIGRRPGSDIPLTEESVSSTHAVILQWEGLRFIRDLGSRTGTFVNGEKVHEVQLNPNDAIRIGETDIIYAPSLEEAAFELITDASDSLIAKTPEAEEINLGENVRLAAAPPAPVKPITVEPAAAEPISEQALPVEETPAEEAAAQETPLVAAPIEEVQSAEPIVEELPPLPFDIDEALLAPEEPVAAKTIQPTQPIQLPAEEPKAVESKDAVEDLVSLAAEETEATEPPAPHDTAHIPLSVAPIEEVVADVIIPPLGIREQNAVVPKSPLTPFDSIDIADTPDLLSAPETASAENFSDAVPSAEATPHEEEDVVSADAQGLEMLEGSAAPQPPEDLPRRGWRSAVTDLTSQDDLVAEPPTQTQPLTQPETEPLTQSTSEQPAATEITEPELAEPEESEPQQTSEDVLQFADEQISTEEPIGSGAAILDQSALEQSAPAPAPADDFLAEPLDLGAVDLAAPELDTADQNAAEVTADSTNDLDLADLFNSAPAARTEDSSPSESLDLSSVDFTDPPRIIADSEEDALETDDKSAEPEAFPEFQSADVSTQPEAATNQPFDAASVDFLTPAQTIAEAADDAMDVVEQPAEPEALPEFQSDEPVAESPAPELSSAVPAASAIRNDEIPSETVADEFVPSGDVSDEDIPADDGESLSSFKARRQVARDNISRTRRRRAGLDENETIDLTEPTPQSALDMTPVENITAEDIAAAAEPVVPLIDLTAGLSDTTFGRAVQEFEGDGAGPIVEEPAPELPAAEILADETAAVELSAPELPAAELPVDESPADQPALEITGDALSSPNAEQSIEPIAFAEAPAETPNETVAPNFDTDLNEASAAAEEIADAVDDEVPAVDAPIFDAATIEESLPPDLSESEKAAFERPMEFATTDLAALGKDSSESADSIPSAPISETLDLSKLTTAEDTMPSLDEAAALDLLLAEQPESDQPDADPHAADPSTLTGHATTDASSEIHAPPPTATEPEHPSIESPAAELPPAPHVAETEIDGADVDLDVWGANQTHYLGGAPLSLREGVHPPKGFGEVSVDFTQPPASEVDASSMPPAKQAPQDPSAEEPTDILPPEAGDAIVVPAPATLSSLTAPPTDSVARFSAEAPAHFPSADQFGADQIQAPMDQVGSDQAATEQAPTDQVPKFAPVTPNQPPTMRTESDALIRSRARGKRSHVIRNGFGQNPNAPKAGAPIVIPPFADNVPGLAGMAMDALAVPPVRQADVFSEMPPAAEVPSAKDLVDAPHNPNEVGREMTSDLWMKTAPLPGRSRRRAGGTPSVIPAIPSTDPNATSNVLPSITGNGILGLNEIAAAAMGHANQVQPAIVLEDENVANAAAQRRGKLLRRVPIFCGVMALLIGAAITACMLLVPVRQQIQATLSFRNFDALTHEEQLKFEVDQDRKLHLDSTRTLAIRKLQNRHPDMQPGFLLAPLAFQSLKLDWPEPRTGEPGLAWVNFEGTDKNSDPARVQAVALAMFEVNADMAGVAQGLKQSMDKLSSNIDSENRQIKELSDKIEHERAIQDGRPTLNELNKLKSDDATLEAAYKDAVAKATDAQAQVDQMNKEHAADAKPAAGTDPVAADAQIKQMSKDADALSAKIAAARKERAELAAKARATLDAAYDEFKKQADGAQNITKDNPQLAAYVTAAQNLQQAIHQLTDEYIQKEQDEYKQLNDFKNSVVAKIQQRQADLFVNDPQLKQLNDQKEILTRQYNEAINSGLDKDAADKKNELTLNDTATKAQKDLISNDPVYNDLLNGLQQMIDQKQKSINDDRKKTDEKLASMQTAFQKSSPTVDQLPAEQKELAAKMQERLAQIDAARKQYAEAADASAAGSDTSLQNMVNDLQTVQTNIETRKRQVVADNSEAARKVRDDQFNATLATKTALVADLNKAVATAQTAYETHHTNLLERQSAADQVAASAQRLEEAIRDQVPLHAAVEQHKAEWDEKKRQADLAVEPLEPEAQARLVGSPIDNRMLYAGISSAGIMVAFLIAICWTVISAARESHHAYTPSFETLDTPSPRKKGGRHAAIAGHETEENEAAVA